MQTALEQASDYWSAQTGGRISFTLGAIVPWYTSTATCADYSSLWSEAAKRTGFTYAPDENLIVVVPARGYYSGACDSYGKGTIGNTVHSSGALYVTDVEPSLWAHELGHNLSLGHANALYDTTRSDVVYSGSYGASRWVNYGDVWDVMSYSSSTIGHGNLGAAGQDRLGVLPGGVRKVVTSGTYRIDALPVADDGAVHGLKVTDPATNGSYFVELRGDSRADDLVASDWRKPTKGVLVTKADGAEAHASVVLDGSPTGNSSSDFDFTVPVGSTMDSASGKLHVTVISADGRSATVRVVLGDADAPTVTVPGAPSSVTASATTSGTASVTWTLGAANGGTVTEQTVTPAVDGVPQPGLQTVVPGTATSATVSGLTNGTAYTFTVKAENEKGYGAASTPSAPVTPADRPGAVATPVAVLSGTTATITWAAPQDNGAAITSYAVTPSRDGAALAPITTRTTTATATVEAGADYTFSVAATNSRGTGTAGVSNVVRYRPPVAPPPAVSPPVVEPPVVTPPVAPAPTPVTPAPAPQTPGNPVRNADGSTTYVAPSGARVVVAADVHAAYTAAGPGLGLPTGDALALTRGGSVQRFEGGLIYTAPALGAHVVRGAVEDLFAAKGWENSSLGYPTSDAIAVKGSGVVQRFQGGLVYSAPTAGTHEVRGAIGEAFAARGWENSTLGFPTSEEIATKAGGVVQRYQGGLMYWTAATGAHDVRGSIGDLYAARGWENSAAGYPTSDEIPLRDGGRVQRFQGGLTYWTPALGAHDVSGSFGVTYAVEGWEGSRWGYPRSDEYAVPGGVRQDYEHGSLSWDRATGRVTQSPR
ncbi:fibronectin type III domain-containing protein [Kineococcus rubinsiae]|uniref:fibronectin type III domain-containing protein n=1 Tax=Kineococcus rubinsiae TaxID=2609562 RepID=UPI00142F742E|nr:fibronectin type III domain-containing protein [Kineococcus rubinsiae]